MRTTVIPAQITTIEDKIAGSFNLTQILLLLAPLFISTFVYAVLPFKMQFTVYKIPFIVLAFLICGTLALRIKGKVVLNWLIVLLRYNIRPKYYVFNKNDSYLRNLYLPVFEKKQNKLFNKAKVTKKVEVKVPSFRVRDMVVLDNYIQNQNLSLSFKSNKKGGLNVAFEQIKK
ncbi:MAG: hypothetical protein M1365_13910 [Actinobacteria bacterium]|nr:hypothetical protein [Actinomycetota bacterium]